MDKHDKRHTTIVTELYQSEKQKSIRASDRQKGNEGYQGDPRFDEYGKALRAGRLSECDALREQHKADKFILARFTTLERMWLSEMDRYRREIQIARREAAGHAYLAKAYRLRLNTEKNMTFICELIRKGEAMLQQAQDAYVIHERLQLPGGFSGV